MAVKFIISDLPSFITFSSVNIKQGAIFTRRDTIPKSTIMKKVCLLIIALTLLTEGSFGYLQRAGRKKRDSCFPLGSGTTPNIENIFLGRCLDFQTKKAIPDACPPRLVYLLNIC